MPTIAENMSGGAKVGNLDPFYGKVSLLLRMDGTNASTTFTDTSPNPKAITTVGNAQISTSQSKYGGSSGYFDGTGDYLTVANSSDNAFGLGDFTIECWVNFSALPGNNIVMCIANTMTSLSSATFTMWWFGLYNNAGTNRLHLGRHGNGDVFAYVNWTPSLNTWYHIAATRSSSSVIGLFINGVSQSVTTSGSNWANDFSATGILSIGLVATALTFNGYIDDFRLTRAARYTASFTPPVAPLSLPGRLTDLTTNKYNSTMVNGLTFDSSKLRVRINRFWQPDSTASKVTFTQYEYGSTQRVSLNFTSLNRLDIGENLLTVFTEDASANKDTVRLLLHVVLNSSVHSLTQWPNPIQLPNSITIGYTYAAQKQDADSRLTIASINGSISSASLYE